MDTFAYDSVIPVCSIHGFIHGNFHLRAWVGHTLRGETKEDRVGEQAKKDSKLNRRIVPLHKKEARYFGIHLTAYRSGRILPARLLKRIMKRKNAGLFGPAFSKGKRKNKMFEGVFHGSYTMKGKL